MSILVQANVLKNITMIPLAPGGAEGDIIMFCFLLYKPKTNSKSESTTKPALHSSYPYQQQKSARLPEQAEGDITITVLLLYTSRVRGTRNLKRGIFGYSLQGVQWEGGAVDGGSSIQIS